MKATFSTLFYLRKNRPNEKGLVPVMCRITINGERTQFSTRLEIHPDQWDSKAGRGMGRSSEIMNTNRILDSTRGRITDLYHNLLRELGYVYYPRKLRILS